MAQPTRPARVFSLLIAALGGEGGAVLAEWIVAAAAALDYPVQSTSIPGVAQRTGATTYYLEIWPAAGPAPLMTLAPAPGQVDVLLASELLEAGRAMLNGFVTPARTALIASTRRAYTTAEKMQMGDGRFDSERLLAAAQTLSRRALLFDMQALARASGTMINAVLFGALAGSGELPLPREACERAMRASGKGAQASLAGFALGFERAAGGAAPEPEARHRARARADALEGFPAGARDVLELGAARAAEFQNDKYAARYLERLRPVAALDPRGDLTREAARGLALWMCYEDVIRVADLKSRASRFARLRLEVRARPHEPVHLVEYFKPRLEEWASLFPPRIASAVLKVGRSRLFARIPNPGLHIRSTGIAGFLALRALAALKPLRPASARDVAEQALIGRWLALVEKAAARDEDLALEVARCARLIKGYGETRARGQRSLLRIFEALLEPKLGVLEDAELARALREARDAALADAEGRGLEGALAARGIEPLPPSAKPLVFVRRPTEAG